MQHIRKQRCSYSTAGQRLCFLYTDKFKLEISGVSSIVNVKTVLAEERFCFRTAAQLKVDSVAILD